MHTSKFAAGFFVGILVAASLSAAEPPILDKIKSKLNRAQTIKAEFDLQIYWAVREKTENKSGLFWLGPGDKFRVELGASLWVSNGTTYWQYNQNSNQVIIKNLLDVDLSLHPSQILKNYLHDHSYAVEKDGSQQMVVTSVPGAGDTQSQIQKISIRIDKKEAMLDKILITDTKGNTSTYSFKKLKTGISIPRERFSFEPPSDANILDTRD
ncbi:MAG: hypothetical protein GF398_14045 [Chitinivibrionales bacterium]|nr:hypothetical protein [Chitinivibrionales bacterium]